ncbi:MAG: trypsin-like peptidase domain-containing protein [Amphiplicatus sp.]|nr:trypsin-like peptidase domain-containing protein [Amphiplicatus sp.]
MSGDKEPRSRIERILGIVIVAALALALAASEIARLIQGDATKKELAALEESVAVARSDAHAALSAVITPETAAKASASVYLIVVNGASRGTAFVIDRDKGVLAGAAHTADSLPLDDEKAQVYIINRETGVRLPVTGRRLHAGFGLFRKTVEAYQPVRKNSSIYSPQAVSVRDLAFDAAYIMVDPIDPATGENRLGPNMKVAPEEKLLAMTPGSPIAVIGYPYDTLDDGYMPDAATPRVERGAVAALIPPLDSASEVRDPVIANLIVHRMSTAGGNSGSPIINADGEVVGIHTHGIESVSGNADGAAQRADVLYDLASPEREEQRLSQVFVPAWSRILTHWARASDVLPWSYYKEYHDPKADNPPDVGDIDYGAPTPFERDVKTLEFGESEEAFKVDAPDAADADPGSFIISTSGQFADYWVSVDRNKENVLFAYDYSLRSRSGSCRIAGYWRKKGDTRLRVVSPRASFELHLPATGEGVQDYQIVLRRAEECDPKSREFIAGEVAWQAGTVVAALPSSDELFAPAPEGAGPTARFTHAVHLSVERIRFCGFWNDKRNREYCERPQFIELEQPVD